MFLFDEIVGGLGRWCLPAERLFDEPQWKRLVPLRNSFTRNAPMNSVIVGTVARDRKHNGGILRDKVDPIVKTFFCLDKLISAEVGFGFLALQSSR